MGSNAKWWDKFIRQCSKTSMFSKTKQSCVCPEYRQCSFKLGQTWCQVPDTNKVIRSFTEKHTNGMKLTQVIKITVTYLDPETDNLWHELQPTSWLTAAVDFDAAEWALSQFAPQEIVLPASLGTAPPPPSVGSWSTLPICVALVWTEHSCLHCHCLYNHTTSVQCFISRTEKLYAARWFTTFYSQHTAVLFKTWQLKYKNMKFHPLLTSLCMFWTRSL